MSVISQKVIKEAKGGVPVNGVILVKGYSVKLTKNCKEYIEGQMQSGSVIPFKAWGQSSAFSMLKNNDFSNCPSMISGSFDEYNGTVSIVVDTIVAVDGYTPSQFLEVRYQKDAYANALSRLCKQTHLRKGTLLQARFCLMMRSCLTDLPRSLQQSHIMTIASQVLWCIHLRFCA